MYRLSKRNVKKDEKANEYLQRTRQKLEDAPANDEQETRVSQDLKNDLIISIFKDTGDEECKPLDPSQITMHQIKV
jgi:hypothetical protein